MGILLFSFCLPVKAHLLEGPQGCRAIFVPGKPDDLYRYKNMVCYRLSYTASNCIIKEKMPVQLFHVLPITIKYTEEILLSSDIAEKILYNTQYSRLLQNAPGKLDCQ